MSVITYNLGKNKLAVVTADDYYIYLRQEPTVLDVKIWLKLYLKKQQISKYIHMKKSKIYHISLVLKMKEYIHIIYKADRLNKNSFKKSNFLKEFS